MELSADQEKQFRQAAKDFSKAMEIRTSLNLRVAKRVTAILRVGMVSFGVVAILLLSMLYAFTSKMDAMIVALDTMNHQFSSMSEDMTLMKTTMHSMERNIAHMPAVTLATRDIRNTIGGMRTEVDGMKKTVANLNYEVYGITNQVGNMTWQMSQLDPAVRYMGRDVNRMSGPMRMFNQFNPFD